MRPVVVVENARNELAEINLAAWHLERSAKLPGADLADIERRVRDLEAQAERKRGEIDRLLAEHPDPSSKRGRKARA